MIRLINSKVDGRSKGLYEVTEKGLNILAYFDEAKELLREEMTTSTYQ